MNAILAVPITAMMMMVSVTMILTALIAKAVSIPVMIIGNRRKDSSQKEKGKEKGKGDQELAMTPGHFIFHDLNIEPAAI